MSVGAELSQTSVGALSCHTDDCRLRLEAFVDIDQHAYISLALQCHCRIWTGAEVIARGV